jgi:hypothetical protein
MKQTVEFHQVNLIKNTGNSNPFGICLGLVVQWLISITPVPSDESKFWTDIKASLADAPHVPLLGVGYAREAIEFQTQYAEGGTAKGVLSTGEYAQQRMAAKKLRFDSAKQFLDTKPKPFNEIANFALTTEGRYFILIMGDIKSSHAIGLHRTYSPIGKSNSVAVFDPNEGKYDCDGKDDIADCLAKLPYGYIDFLVESYTS